MEAYVFLYALCFVAALALPVKEGCEETKCKGPMKFYKDLECTPVYKNPEDCCPYRYNCDQLKNRTKDKCYINGKSYDIGQSLEEEDANPCDVGCKCLEQLGVATFICAELDCFPSAPRSGCYQKNSPLDCCPGEEVCPEKPEDRVTCEVDGKIYKDGESFSVAGEPEKDCVCMPGFEGKFVEPFCATPKHPYCSAAFRHAYELHNNCTPVYYNSQSPQKDCAVSYRCQNDKDEVIRNDSSERKSTESSEENSEEMKCKFGKLEMRIGDELSQATDYSSVCVKCVCEVPPTPTCQRLPDDQCDVAKHPSFNRK